MTQESAATRAAARLVLLGPPGAGKGTQAQRLGEHLGVPAISTGDIFRRNAAEGTALGREARRYLDAGEYVPDAVTNAIVRDRLSQPDTDRGFLLDGYPRTVAQVEELDAILGDAGTPVDAVLELTAHVDEVVRRLLKRAQAEGRSDDTEDVVRRRLQVYVEQTAPLTAVYARRGLLVSVDGSGDVEDVTDRLVAALEAHRRTSRVPGFDRLLGVRFVCATGSRVVLELDVRADLYQPFGVLHGGALCSLVETAASVGATEWLAGRGHAVGLRNCTTFRSSVTSGRLTVVAEPVRQGRSQQLWSVFVTAESGLVVAEGEVRLATRTGGPPAPVIGSPALAPPL